MADNSLLDSLYETVLVLLWIQCFIKPVLFTCVCRLEKKRGGGGGGELVKLTAQ